MLRSPTTAPDRAPTDTTDRDRDASLVRRIAIGDQGALREAYDEHAAAVNGVALGILRDRDLAADVTQEVFVRLWERTHRYDAGRGSLRSFLQMDAHGRSIDLMRSRRSAQARELADHRKEASTERAGTEELAMTAVTSTTVRTALLELPEEQRTPIALAFFDGHSYRDVAEMLGVPEGTVKSRIRSGIRRLHLALGTEAT